MKFQKFTALLCGLVAATTIFAKEATPATFTQEELREQARVYVAVIDKKEKVSSESAIKMSQFYGYIMGYLDSISGPPSKNDLFVECTKKSPKEVVLKAARVIAQSKLDRTESVRFSVTLAIGAACSDEMWKK